MASARQPGWAKLRFAGRCTIRNLPSQNSRPSPCLTPPQLREALIRRFQWEIPFTVKNAEPAITSGEQMHVAGCVYRALACIAQVLFALNERHLINEKGALSEAAAFPLTIPALMPRVAEIWRLIGGKQFEPALAALREIEQELKALTTVPQA
jgi:hypothetical protein